MLFSSVAAPAYIPTNSAKDSLSSTSLPTCEVISHCGSDMHFPEYFFMYLLVICLWSFECRGNGPYQKTILELQDSFSLIVFKAPVGIGVFKNRERSPTSVGR